MLARELHAWLRSLHAVPEPSVDRLIVGDPETAACGIAVMWMPTWAALRSAEARGLNVIVAHEPTFYTHHDLEGFAEAFAHVPPQARAALEQTRDAKRAWIEERGMVVIRCHDVLDAMPGGVVDSLAQALGFSASDYVSSPGRHRVVRLSAPTPAGEVAQRLASAFAALKQPGVAFYGDPLRSVRTLGLGTGYGCDPWNFVEFGADMAVTIDDRIKTWSEPVWCDDSGYPMVVIHHGTSEEWGVQRLAAIIAEKLAPLPVDHIAQGFTAKWIEGARRKSPIG